MTRPRDIRFLTTQEVVEIHFHGIKRGGGSLGLRDGGLLDSAVHVAQATYGGEWLYPDLFQKAAAYLVHLALNHPFVDGNKRMAWLSACTFLRANGYRVKPRWKDAVAVVEAIGSGEARDLNQIARWLADNAESVD